MITPRFSKDRRVISLASACESRRTLCSVNPSPISARHPPVPKAIRFCSSCRRGRYSRFCKMNSARSKSASELIPCTSLRPPPPAGAEGDQVLFFLPPRTVQPLLQNELGTLEVRIRIDPLHLVLIVELVVLDLKPRPYQLVHAIGETIIAIHRRR